MPSHGVRPGARNASAVACAAAAAGAGTRHFSRLGEPPRTPLPPNTGGCRLSRTLSLPPANGLSGPCALSCFAPRAPFLAVFARCRLFSAVSLSLTRGCHLALGLKNARCVRGSVQRNKGLLFLLRLPSPRVRSARNCVRHCESANRTGHQGRLRLWWSARLLHSRGRTRKGRSADARTRPASTIRSVARRTRHFFSPSATLRG